MRKAIDIEIINKLTEIFVRKLEVNQDLAQQVGLNDSVCGLYSEGLSSNFRREAALLTEGFVVFLSSSRNIPV
jgi:hypothetical protein